MWMGKRQLLRLAYAEACRELSDRARGLVPTYADAYARPGELVESALQLRAQANEVLRLAVAAERANGASWQAIADALDMTRQSAHERFADTIREIDDGVLFPHRAGPAGQPGWWACPDGLDDPERTLHDLDAWVVRHRERTDPRHDLRDPVSAGLQQPTDEARASAHRSIDAIGVVTEVARRMLDGTLPPGVTDEQARQVLLEHKLIAHAEGMRKETGARQQQARELYDDAWKELVALHHKRLAERLTTETHDDAASLKLRGRLVGVLERGDGHSAETTGWFLWFAEASGEVDTDRGPEWICDAEATAEQAVTDATPVLLHDLATNLAKGYTAAVVAQA